MLPSNILENKRQYCITSSCCREIYHCPVLHASHAQQILFIISATFLQFPYLIFTTLSTLNLLETQPADKMQPILLGLQTFKLKILLSIIFFQMNFDFIISQLREQ